MLCRGLNNVGKTTLFWQLKTSDDYTTIPTIVSSSNLPTFDYIWTMDELTQLLGRALVLMDDRTWRATYCPTATFLEGKVWSALSMLLQWNISGENKGIGNIFPPVDGELSSILYILVNNFDLTRSMAADIAHCIVSQLLLVYPVVRKRE